jgi:hypothetical protein
MALEGSESARRPVRAGRFFTQKEIKAYRKNFEDKDPENKGLRKAEFFSKNLIEQLLSVEGCDGLRIYYGLAPENKEGKIDFQAKENLQPRLFLVPVTVGRDADGNPTEENKDQVFYLRVDSGKDGGDESGGVGEGNPCPNFCNP